MTRTYKTNPNCKKCGNLRKLVSGWQSKHKSVCRNCLNEWRRKNKDRVNEQQKKHYDKIKLEVFNHYCGGDIKCACCGEKQIEFLTIDHINGDGAKERKESNTKGGKIFYAQLKKKGYPAGYQVLCFNCNCAKGFSGQCPHKKND